MNTGGSWDRRVEAFDTEILPDSDPFLQIILRNVRLSKDSTDILDIGCGTGAVSLGLADRVRSITGVDISPKMVEAAGRKADGARAFNASFKTADWDTAEPAEIGRFNLVLAHMTPAVHDGATFAKMLAVSSGWCFLAGYISRESPVWDEVYRIVGEPGVPEFRKITAAQEVLWRMGLAPRIEYIRERRARTWSAEYAKMFYTEAVRSYTAFTPEQEVELCRWIDSRSENGMFVDESDPVIGVLHWDSSVML